MSKYYSKFGKKSKFEKDDEQLEKNKLEKLMCQYQDILNHILKKNENNTDFDRVSLFKELRIMSCSDIRDSMFNRLINVFKFNINQLRRIMYVLKFQGEIYLISNIEKNPYEFYDEDGISLIPFAKSEKIYNENNLSVDIKIRIKSWIIHCFIHEEKSFYVEVWKVERKYIDYFKDSNELLRSMLIKIRVNNKDYYTTHEFQKIEKSLGDLFMDLYYESSFENMFQEYALENIDTYIQSYESKVNKKLTCNQVDAVKNGIKQKFHIITGYPGTGKSTILEFILNYKIEVQNVNKNEIFIVAPTGIATKTLMDKCSHIIPKENGMTIHKLLMYMQNKKRMKSPKYICVDESSMVNFYLFRNLLEKVCLPNDCHLTLIGDINQLPPIGLGEPFKNILQCGFFDDHINMLNEIKRQDGSLSRNIIKMNTEILSIEDDFDNISMKFIKCDNFKSDNMRKLFIDILNTYNGNKPNTSNINKNKVQFVLSQNSTSKCSFGVDTCNDVLQRIWNPDGLMIEPKPQYKNMITIGDIVCRTENDYSDEENCKIRVNGDMGIILNQTREGVRIEYFDNEYEIVSAKELYQIFNLHYATTVHKMQGSEKEVVVIIIHPEHKYMWGSDMDRKKLLYTAISRATKTCIIIGDTELFLKAQTSCIYKDKLSYFMKKFDTYE